VDLKEEHIKYSGFEELGETIHLERHVIQTNAVLSYLGKLRDAFVDVILSIR